MKQNTLVQLGFEMINDTDKNRIVFVRYFGDQSLPKYKRPCQKIIFCHASKEVEIKGRNERGNQISYGITVNELTAVCQIAEKLGWLDYAD